mmetsp:Transcript_108214/g.312762  ORF Transcript_108214/g.312762 Transcript_108214/m.312762 type:complete len:204 (-) Transcript_108214:535-1146(-)
MSRPNQMPEVTTASCWGCEGACAQNRLHWLSRLSSSRGPGVPSSMDCSGHNADSVSSSARASAGASADMARTSAFSESTTSALPLSGSSPSSCGTSPSSLKSASHGFRTCRVGLSATSGSSAGEGGFDASVRMASPSSASAKSAHRNLCAVSCSSPAALTAAGAAVGAAVVAARTADSSATACASTGLGASPSESETSRALCK